MERIPLREHPYLFDKVVQRIQRALGDSLVWLDHAFGLAERITRVIDGKKFTLPNLWVGGNEYIDLMPDQMRGSFAFCYLDEPQKKADGRMRGRIQMIVWWDTRNIDAELRDMERVKSQVLDALGRVAGVEVVEIYDRPASIYKGFTFDETASCALMHPFAGIRVAMDVYVEPDCNPYV